MKEATCNINYVRELWSEDMESKQRVVTTTKMKQMHLILRILYLKLHKTGKKHHGQHYCQQQQQQQQQQQ